LDDIVNNVLDGNTVLLVNQLEKVLVFNAKGGVGRGPSEPNTQTAVRGPHEGFTDWAFGHSGGAGGKPIPLLLIFLLFAPFHAILRIRLLDF
jgi:hypothetical protein